MHGPKQALIDCMARSNTDGVIQRLEVSLVNIDCLKAWVCCFFGPSIGLLRLPGHQEDSGRNGEVDLYPPLTSKAIVPQMIKAVSIAAADRLKHDIVRGSCNNEAKRSFRLARHDWAYKLTNLHLQEDACVARALLETSAFSPKPWGPKLETNMCLGCTVNKCICFE